MYNKTTKTFTAQDESSTYYWITEYIEFDEAYANMSQEKIED